jgi:hypothetical protein
MFLLARLVGCEILPMWWRILSAPRMASRTRLSASTARLLEGILEADTLLYDDACAALEDAVGAARFGSALDRYRDAARRQPELPDAWKAVECLRWRQVLADSAAAASAPRPESEAHSAEARRA